MAVLMGVHHRQTALRPSFGDPGGAWLDAVSTEVDHFFDRFLPVGGDGGEDVEGLGPADDLDDSRLGH